MIKTTWKWLWMFFNIVGFPVFVFKQIVSAVALWDSAKTIIAMDEEERATAANKQD